MGAATRVVQPWHREHHLIDSNVERIAKQLVRASSEDEKRRDNLAAC
jgi:hypothetical protein